MSGTTEIGSIEEIESQYRTIRLKFGVERRTDKFDTVPEEVPRISLDMVESWTADVAESREEEPQALAGLVKFHEGDVCFSKLRPYLAKAFEAEYFGAASPEFLVFHPTQFETRFLRYLLLSREFIDRVDASTYGAKMPRASWNFIGNVRVPCPDKREQEKITKFLDRHTARIDALVEKQNRLLDLLDEKRQAVISRVVTSGLNSETEMVQSDIDWFGELPSHWEIGRLGIFSDVVNGSTPSRKNPEYWSDGSVVWLPSTKLNDRVITEPSEWITETALAECGLRKIPAGSVLVGIVGQGKTRGMSALLEIDATINQNTAAVIPQKRLSGAYLYYLFRHMYAPLRQRGRGANQPALDCRTIAEFQVPIPPRPEQEKIVSYLDNISEGIEVTIARIDQSIDLLEEKRQALITAAVTGQIDVTEEHGEIQDSPV